MPLEKIIWTALPNGKNGTKLRLSAHVSFRLTGAAAVDKVSSFPTLVNYDPTKLKFTAFIEGKAYPCTIVTDKKVAAVQGYFQKYFPATAPVTSADYVPQKPIPIYSFHATGVGKYVTDLQALAVTSGFDAKLKLSDAVEHPLIKAGLVFNDNLALDQKALKSQGFTGSSNKSAPSQSTRVKLKNDNRLKAADAARTQGTFVKDLSSQFVEAHAFFDKDMKPKTPFTAKKPDVDFHQAIAAVGTHSDLMRLLGIVFDLEIEGAGVPATGQIYLTVEGMPDSPIDDVHYPRTVFVNSDDFRAKPREFVGSSSDIVDGFMDMSEDKVQLGTIDVNGGIFSVASFAVQVYAKFADFNMKSAKATQFSILLPTFTLELAKSISHPDENIQQTPAFLPDVEEADLPPAQRTGGISLYRVNRVQRVSEMRAVSDALYAKIAAAPTAAIRGAAVGTLLKKTPDSIRAAAAAAGSNEPIFFADDLLKGWRPDVHFRGKWHSLTRRQNVHKIGGVPSLIETSDEGQISFGTTKDSASDTTQKLHESIFTWEGWSLIARRPGYAVKDDGSLDSSYPQTKAQFPAWADNPANLDANFKNASYALAEPKTLPLLRFGLTYAVRARAVDLAGNSVALSVDHDDDKNETTQQSTIYLRYEPIVAPQLKNTVTNPQRGDSDGVMVIRKSLAKTTPDDSNRWVIPPDSSIQQAELHGLLDDANGNPDASKWQMLADYDKKAPLPQVLPVSQAPSLPYLPDPAANGATLICTSGYPLGVTKTSFYGQGTWPNAGAFLLVLKGSTMSKSEVQGKNMVVSLRPGQRVTMGISSNTVDKWLPHFSQTWALEDQLEKENQSMIPIIKTKNPALGAKLDIIKLNKPFMGGLKAPKVTNPGSTFKKAGANRDLNVSNLALGNIAAIQVGPKFSNKLIGAPRQLRKGIPTDILSSTQKLINAYLDGLNTGLTPNRPVQLVYAVQVPEPGYNAQIRSHRLDGQTMARTVVDGKIHGWSTNEIELLAEYTDDVDDVKEAVRKTVSVTQKHRAFSLAVPYYENDPINDIRRLENEEFHDTKCHYVSYTVIAKSRYANYFPEPDPKNPATRTSEVYPYKAPTNNGFVIVPSSTRAPALPVEYIMPVFDWGAETVGTKKYSARRGMMVRVFLRRPWFLTGQGEQVGVVIANGVDDSAKGQHLARYSTLWGADPAFKNEGIPGLPATTHFKNNNGVFKGLPLAEVAGATCDIVAYTPSFDEARQMWYVDIEVRPPAKSYTPFLRLSLCRFQANSITDAYKVGAVSVCDITQLQPDRLVTVESTVPNKTVVVKLTGQVGSSALGTNWVVGTLEEKIGNDPNLGWSPVYDSEGYVYERTIPVIDGNASLPTIKLFTGAFSDAPPAIQFMNIEKPTAEEPLASYAGMAKLFTVPGQFELPDAGKSYRVVVREYERHRGNFSGPGRLIHVDAVVIK